MIFGRPQRLCGLCQLLNADVTWFLVYNESRVNSILILSAREDACSFDRLWYFGVLSHGISSKWSFTRIILPTLVFFIFWVSEGPEFFLWKFVSELCVCLFAKKFGPSLVHVCCPKSRSEQMPGVMSPVATSFCTVAHNIYGPSTWSLLRVTLLASGTSKEGGGSRAAPLQTSQNRNLKNTYSVDIMISKFNVISPSAESNYWSRLMTSTLEF